MRDPHVVSLYYRLETGDTTSYKDPPPIQDERAEFKMCLADGRACFEMKEHYPSEESARNIVEEYLGVWELDVDLRLGPGEFHFEYEKACIIDRNPPTAGTTYAQAVDLSDRITLSGSFSAHVNRNKYPNPPNDLKLSPDVKTLWFRYQLYLDEHEQLSSMGYFCLSFIENKFKGRGKVAKECNVDISALNKLGMLTSAVGDYQTARKIDSNHTLRPYTNQEMRWIEEAVKKLIRRVAEYDFDPQASQKLPRITMADLPPLGR